MKDLRTLRDGLGHFATGVTVVTCTDAQQHPCGITANSFSSVSLTPPLVLWNIAKVSQSLEAYLAAKHFGISVLDSSQRDVSRHFAQSQHDLFGGIAHDMSPRGVPRLSDTLAWFECATHEIHDCGDHFIIVGEVLDFEARDGEPLLFFGGRYRHLGST
jgi:flavin reductase (DIM6/NTAB) family NADH-FMN oxidoreductase RutF